MSQDAIRKVLVDQRIQLWNPPYYGVRQAKQQMQQLASTFASLHGHNDVLPQLQDLQQRALTKLRSKGKWLEQIDIQIKGGYDTRGTQDFPETWACHVTCNAPNSICLQQPNPQMTVEKLVQDLEIKVLKTKVWCLIHKGRVLQGHEKVSDLGENNNNNMAFVWCLVKFQNSPHEAAATRSTTTQSIPDQTLIESIRTAAAKLQSTSFALDITDGAGQLVPMNQDEQRAFSTALGYHALGKQRMNEQRWELGLMFLLQADQEWDQHLDPAWRHQVDNYGLLQLDICWLYWKFAAIENLPHVMERLANAEAAIRKQVNVNFVTLSLVQAEMGNPVPALAAIFVRLFLLQGIAFHYHGNVTKSKERLDWARQLSARLRAVSPPESVARLCEALQVSPATAISALRRSNGNADQAVEIIQQEDVDAEKATADRYKQRALGLCANGRDYVNLLRLQELKPLLGLGDDEFIASGLLRLANNSVVDAFDRYQSYNRDVSLVLQHVAELDASQGVSHKRPPFVVDEMALATLESMGVDNITARRGLERTRNNVDQALVWITQHPCRHDSSASCSDNSAVPNGVDSEVHDATNFASMQEVAAAAAEQVEPVRDTPPDEGNDNDTDDGYTTPQDPFHPRYSEDYLRQQAEREAVALLQQALGRVLEQDEGDKAFLGNSLDEEWNYLKTFGG